MSGFHIIVQCMPQLAIFDLAIIHSNNILTTLYVYLSGPELRSILNDAICLEKAFQDEMAEIFSAFISAEESFLKLSSYDGLTDGMCYILPFRFKYNDETFIYTRYRCYANNFMRR